ncbi:hypothetical protein CARUB_v10019428mg, partial [Capsella rubella]
MDLFGEFQKGEIDGKPYLLYHNVMKPLPQIQTPNSSDEETTIQKPLPIQNKTNSSEKLPLQPRLRFVCPTSRRDLTVSDGNITTCDEDGLLLPDLFFKLTISPLSGDNTSYRHVVFPSWSNNKESDLVNGCGICKTQMVGTNTYFCVACNERYHKECVESPLEITYPSHVKHSLQLYYSKKLSELYCIIAAIPFFIDQPRRHDHTLSLFPRQASLTCNVCALVNKLHLTYVCRSICDFVAHKDCIYIPQTIRISRHQHRVSFASSLPVGISSCGVCRQEVDREYGGYTCKVCSGYVVHTRCALRQDISDGIELEGVPDEDGDIKPPFKFISDGIILHFSHGCYMKFDGRGVYDGNKFCQACALPINEENLYECAKCDFIIHERCAEAPRKMFYPLHPHPLKQKVVHDKNVFICEACDHICNGFGYECTKEDCDYILDVVCASASEPFNYQGHQHPLYLALRPNVKPICRICKSAKDSQVFNCIDDECDFIICFECVTLPYMVKYKHDEHYLTFCHGDEASGSDWCELCEGKLVLRAGGKDGFYKCNDCCTTIHINCLLGPHLYMKPGQTFTFGNEWLVIRNTSPRLFCYVCNMRRPYPIIFLYEGE